ncbi:lysophospholipid acyltransferase family protein [Limobrevibacterium gyesilva]|uniref:1-acyl-sn-glycerol-3-phosphate acyltransferase n=1 Tax=Limobrevibacterium gyesilva TaxID=2991712 RepID=A0AA41YLD7_9PROT|nr:lysophospholipid acyltransferase family protein [Limobrevibacterium gyesilva]MCW3474551.1 1-acyl-sn-glycerol-3-phosphate acyltransferase [Limobrevibacterium gyesilva]
MQAAPSRLTPKRIPLLRNTQQGGDDGSWGAIVPSRGHVLRRLRVFRRGIAVLLWTIIAVPLQAVLIALPGRAKVVFARSYWAVMCWLIGMRVRVIGAPAHRTADGRPVVFVSNHSSWLDILVLGGRLDACFIAKEEVARWPLIGTIAKLGRTVYVRRARTSTGRERDEMRARLAGGDNLILFPEGTTSDGSRVLPFRSAFLSVAELPATADGKPPLVQPVSVVYDRLAGLPTGRASRPLFAWYGDMDIGSHFWRLAQHRGLRATVLLHTPLDPAAFPSRKALAQATFTAVADGASTMRQNRPASPITVAAGGAAAPETAPAYA